jgi:hypothetical protein
MPIREIELENFKDKIINSSLDYPKSANKNLFNLFFNYLGVASRGGGKTYNAVKIIKEYEKSKMFSNAGETSHKIRTILISPTYDANKNLWKNLKSLDENDIYEEYTEEILKNIIDDVKGIIDEVDIYNKYIDYYDLIEKTPKEEIQLLLKINPEIPFLLNKFNYENPTRVKKYFRYTSKPITFIILDDIMGSSALNRKSENLLKYWLVCFYRNGKFLKKQKWIDYKLIFIYKSKCKASP